MISREALTKSFWSLTKEKTLEILDSSPDGLSEDEVRERLSVFGRNVLPQDDGVSKIHIVLNQLKSPIIYILIFAGAVTLALQDFKSSLFIFVAVFINSALGFYQENKAETALQSLRIYLKERVRVVREGEEKEVDVGELVPGDVVRLLPGARVPADGRLLLADEFSVDESILTGESLQVTDKSDKPVSLNASLPDQKSMVFAGTLVEGGVGMAAVTGTGSGTELGKIARAVRTIERESTPLQISLGRFAVRASLILGLLTLLLFIFGIYSGHRPFEMFLISVAVAVSAVPEGLPIALTVILSVGVERLARRKGIVRKLLAAETLGSTTLILTDKTGTLTQAKMELAKIVSHRPKEEILAAALINTDVIVENPGDEPNKWRIIGRPLEAALVRAAAEYRVLLPKIKDNMKILNLVPFNSTLKFSAVYLESDGKKFWNYIGAPEVLIGKSKLSRIEKEKILRTLDNLAYAGHRVLGVLRDGDFYGLIAFKDPVRPGVSGALKKVSLAGVRTVMVTGDHKGTAEALAKEVGLAADTGEVLAGSELQKMSDGELKRKINQIKIFARVTPEDKLRLTRVYMSLGEVVAVTGDGVNDAPALKNADIGVALGTGTDVTKGASDLIILDDNFETIVSAIEEGRRILDNVKKVIIYLLSNSLDGLFLIGGSIMAGVALPLNALQILWVNFFLDSFPASALAFEDGKDYLKLPPSKVKKELFDSQLKFLILVIGVISSFLLFVMYFILLKLGFEDEVVRTFIFASLSTYTLFLVFSIRNLNLSILSYNFFSNPYLLVSVIIGMGLTLLAIYLPRLQDVLGTVALPLPWLAGVVVFGFLNVLIVEFSKLLFKR